jgi:hypothetical protein
MANVKVRSPKGSVGDPTAFAFISMVDQNDGTFAPQITTATGADIVIRSPWPAANDPTNFPLLGLKSNGDGTYSLIVVAG